MRFPIKGGSVGALLFGILALRHPDVLLDPQLTWEDGRIFLGEAITTPWYSAWATPFIGYFIVLPKMVAGLFTPLTMVHAPLVFNAFSLAMMAFSMALPLLPAFSHLAPWGYRAAWVAACALLPWHTETFANLTGTHWYAYFALTLFSIGKFNASAAWVKVLLPLLVLLGTFTTPNVVLIAPVLVARLWLERRTRGYQFHLTLVTLASIGLMAAAVLIFVPPAGNREPPDPTGIAPFLLKGLGYKVVVQTLAGRLAARLLWHTWASVAGASLFVLLMTALVRSARRGRDEVVPVAMASLYYIIASIALCAVTRPQYITHFVRLDNYWGADRYFVTPSFYFLLLLVLAARQWNMSQWPMRLKGPAAVVCGAIIAMNFRYPPIPDFHWHRQLRAYYARLLDYPPSAPAARFAIVTYPGDPWILQAPLYSPAESDRPAIQRLIRKLSD